MSRSVPCGCEKTQGKETHEKDMTNRWKGTFMEVQGNRDVNVLGQSALWPTLGVVGKIRNSWSIESPSVNYSISLNFSTAILDPHRGILPLIAVRITIAKCWNKKQLGVGNTRTKEKKQQFLRYNTSIYFHFPPLPTTPLQALTAGR